MVGWKLKPEDTSAVEATTDTEYVLSGAPLELYVEVKTRVSLNTEDRTVEIVDVLPKKQSWSPAVKGNIRISRCDFQLVPDLAGTIHSFVGTSLDAAMLD